MTRTTKANDVPHNNSNNDNNSDPAASPSEKVPRNFGKHTAYGSEPKGKAKKDGGGKGNWGHVGDEMEDLDEYNPTKPRRYSNSATAERHDVKSKFETNDADPVFEEDMHGPKVEESATTEKLEDLIVDKKDTSA